MTHPPLRVTVQDLRTARICLQGARPWFRRHGFDWGAFVAGGIEAERLAATGDAQALRVVDVAQARVDAMAGIATNLTAADGEPAATIVPTDNSAPAAADIDTTNSTPRDHHG